MKLSCLALTAVLFLPVVAEAANDATDPGYFQESYDQEAVGKNQEALAALDRLSSDKNASYLACLRRGWLQYRLGKNALAIEAYNQAIALAPKAVEPRLGILLPLLAAKEWDLTEKSARGILKLDPKNYSATLRLAFALYSQNRFAESHKLYQRLVDSYPSDIEARGGLGWALLKQGKTKEAAAVFKALLDFAPKNVLGQQGLAATAAKRSPPQ